MISKFAGKPKTNSFGQIPFGPMSRLQASAVKAINVVNNTNQPSLSPPQPPSQPQSKRQSNNPTIEAPSSSRAGMEATRPAAEATRPAEPMPPSMENRRRESSRRDPGVEKRRPMEQPSGGNYPPRTSSVTSVAADHGREMEKR